MAAVTVLVAAGGSANAADTITTFTVNTAGLTITAPGTSDLGSGSAGTAISAALGDVTVTDARALLTASWVATVTSSDFTTGGATPAETVPVADVSYWSGPLTASTGTGTFTRGQPDAAAAVPIEGATAMTLTAGVGDNTATWDPTLVVHVPAAAVGGVYTGTVTHSVA